MVQPPTDPTVVPTVDTHIPGAVSDVPLDITLAELQLLRVRVTAIGAGAFHLVEVSIRVFS